MHSPFYLVPVCPQTGRGTGHKSYMEEKDTMGNSSWAAYDGPATQKTGGEIFARFLDVSARSGRLVGHSFNLGRTLAKAGAQVHATFWWGVNDASPECGKILAAKAARKKKERKRGRKKKQG